MFTSRFDDVFLAEGLQRQGMHLVDPVVVVFTEFCVSAKLINSTLR